MKRPRSKNLQFSLGFFPLFLAMMLGLLSGNVLLAQEEAEENEPLKTRMSLSVVQGDEDMATLKALVRAKIDERYTGLPGLEVVFFSITDSLEQEMGKATTDEDGIAALGLPRAKLLADTSGAFPVMAVFEGNDEFSDSDDEIAFTAAKITLEALEEDSTRTLAATLESSGEPVAEADIYFYVKGLFRPLKIGEATTDEDGMASVEFPADLPGDPEGNLNIIVRLEEDDAFGTVETNMSKAWGVPQEITSGHTPRELWSPSPPLWLLLTFIALLAIIWGHYLEVIYKLFRLRKKAAES